MPRYVVLVKEVHFSHIAVDAGCPLGAIRMIERGDGQLCREEFGYTLDADEWLIQFEDQEVYEVSELMEDDGDASV